MEWKGSAHLDIHVVFWDCSALFSLLSLFYLSHLSFPCNSFLDAIFSFFLFVFPHYFAQCGLSSLQIAALVTHCFISLSYSSASHPNVVFFTIITIAMFSTLYRFWVLSFPSHTTSLNGIPLHTSLMHKNGSHIHVPNQLSYSSRLKVKTFTRRLPTYNVTISSIFNWFFIESTIFISYSSTVLNASSIGISSFLPTMSPQSGFGLGFKIRISRPYCQQHAFVLWD